MNDAKQVFSIADQRKEGVVEAMPPNSRELRGRNESFGVGKDMDITTTKIQHHLIIIIRSLHECFPH